MGLVGSWGIFSLIKDIFLWSTLMDAITMKVEESRSMVTDMWGVAFFL